MTHDNWYTKALSRLNQIDEGLHKKYKIALLKNMIVRLNQNLLLSCEQCHHNKEYIDEMIEILETQNPDPKKMIYSYKVRLNNLLDHFSHNHKLYVFGEYAFKFFKGSLLTSFIISLIVFDFPEIIYATISVTLIATLIGLAIDFHNKKNDKII